MKKMDYTIGIDIATSGVKIIAIDEEGKVVESITEEYNSIIPQPNWSEQAPEEWWNKTIIGINKIIKRVGKGKIRGIGLTGQMHGLVLIDKKGNVLRNAILWNDQRCVSECEEIINKIGQENLIKLTYNTALTGFTAGKILWVKKNEPKIYEKIHKILLPKDYIRFKLTGEIATDVSDASGTLLFNVEKRNWCNEVLKALQISKEHLPSCFESIEKTGEITDKCAKQTGLKKATAVYGGGGDQAAQAVGSGIVKNGLTSCTIGTSGVVFTCTDKPLFDPYARLHSFCHAVPQKWHIMGVMLSAGGSFKWLQELINSFSFNDFNSENMKKLKSLRWYLTYSDLTKIAEKSKLGANGLIFLPYITGERTPYPDPYARGVFFGLSSYHTKSDLIRAVLEGIAFGLRDSLQLTKEIGVNIKQIRLSGGGAQSPFWRKIITDIFGVETVLTKVTEGAAYGAALLASVGCGIFDTVESACKRAIITKDHLQPNTENHQKYNEFFNFYRSLYPKFKEQFEKLYKISLS